MSEEVVNVAEQVELLLKEIPKDLLEAGVFYGRKKRQTHPRAKSFILTNRNGIEVINPIKIVESLEPALTFLKKVAQDGGSILIVATQSIIENLAIKTAEEINAPYVTKRWLGGTLTNFKVISKRVEHFQKLKKDLAGGVYDKYTKKERLDIEREANGLEELLGGLVKLTHTPNVIVTIDPRVHIIAVREAKILKIPTVAFTNIDFDPEFIEYPVIGNTKSRKSIQWFFEKIEEAVREGMAARKLEVVKQENLQEPSVEKVVEK